MTKESQYRIFYTIRTNGRDFQHLDGKMIFDEATAMRMLGNIAWKCRSLKVNEYEQYEGIEEYQSLDGLYRQRVHFMTLEIA